MTQKNSKNYKPTAGRDKLECGYFGNERAMLLSYDESVTPLGAQVTARRERKVRAVEEEIFTDELVTLDLEKVCAQEPRSRVQWLETALLQTAERRLKLETVYGIITNPSFIEGVEGSKARKMKRTLDANLHVFTPKQKKSVQSVMSELPGGDRMQDTDKPAKSKEPQGDRVEGGRRRRAAAGDSRSRSPALRSSNRSSRSAGEQQEAQPRKPTSIDRAPPSTELFSSKTGQQKQFRSFDFKSKITSLEELMQGPDGNDSKHIRSPSRSRSPSPAWKKKITSVEASIQAGKRLPEGNGSSRSSGGQQEVQPRKAISSAVMFNSSERRNPNKFTVAPTPPSSQRRNPNKFTSAP